MLLLCSNCRIVLYYFMLCCIILCRTTSNNIDTFIKREIRRITTNSVQDRKHPMFAVPPLPQSAPWANDPEAMYNADPLFCSGNFHEEMDRLQSVRSGINVKGWISGHRLHCARCALIRADWLQTDCGVFSPRNLTLLGTD